MAKAPRPGVGKRADEVKAAKVVHKLRIGDETRTIALMNVPMKERLIVRKATGFPLESFLAGEIGIDSLMVIWWLAGRAAGDPFLTLEQVEREWPEEFDEGSFELLEVTADDPDEDGDDPQS